MSLKINFYCNEKYSGCVPEPIPASKKFPKWFSEMPLNKKRKLVVNEGNIYDIRRNEDDANIKGCLGISEFLNTGYIIPSWADFIFREQDDGNLYVNWLENYFDETNLKIHGEEQYFTMPNKPIYGHFGKIPTPWSIKTDKGVSCLITHPIWHNKSFTSSTAIVHTDQTPLRLAWFFEWNYKIQTKMDVDNMDYERQVISKGEPIILIIPFYRKKFSHKINYISEELFERLEDRQHHSTHKSITGSCPYIEFRKTLGKLF